jgi:hypothetical protein
MRVRANEGVCNAVEASSWRNFDPFSHLAASDSMDLSISQVSQWNESTYLSPIQEQKIQ